MNLSELSTFNSFLITTFESWFICAKSPAIHKKFNLEFCKDEQREVIVLAEHLIVIKMFV